MHFSHIISRKLLGAELLHLKSTLKIFVEWMSTLKMRLLRAWQYLTSLNIQVNWNGELTSSREMWSARILEKSIHMIQKKYAEHRKASQHSQLKPIYMKESFTGKKGTFCDWITAQLYPCRTLTPFLQKMECIDKFFRMTITIIKLKV